MRAILLGGLVIAAAFALPDATAQVASSSTTLQLHLEPPVGQVEPGSLLVFPGKVEYAYPGTGQAESTGTEVTFNVTGKPDWATVVVTPSHLVLPVSGTDPVAVRVVSRTVQVAVHVEPDAPERHIGVIDLVAVATPNGNLEGSSAQASFTTETGELPRCLIEVAAASGPSEGRDEPQLVEAHGRASSFLPAEGARTVIGFAAAGACLGGWVGLWRRGP